MKQVAWASCLALVLITGCASNEKAMNPADFPTHVYKQPYDLVYKKALDVLGAQSGWILDPTNKAEGTIDLQGTGYGNVLDMDNQKARFIIKSVNRALTSVGFDAGYSACKSDGCQKMYNQLDKVLGTLPPAQEVPEKS